MGCAIAFWHPVRAGLADHFAAPIISRQNPPPTIDAITDNPHSANPLHDLSDIVRAGLAVLFSV
jgi:hypothetical protein